MLIKWHGYQHGYLHIVKLSSPASTNRKMPTFPKTTKRWEEWSTTKTTSFTFLLWAKNWPLKLSGIVEWTAFLHTQEFKSICFNFFAILVGIGCETVTAIWPIINGVSCRTPLPAVPYRSLSNWSSPKSADGNPIHAPRKRIWRRMSWTASWCYSNGSKFRFLNSIV